MTDDPQGFEPVAPKHKRKSKSKSRTVTISIGGFDKARDHDMYTLPYEVAATLSPIRVDSNGDDNAD